MSRQACTIWEAARRVGVSPSALRPWERQGLGRPRREEFLYLLSGALTVWVGDDEIYQLTRAGDALSVPSTLPHRWRNDAGGETRLLWINTPPMF